MKKVLLTGGSSGIGKEINLFLLEKGYNVFFTYCNSKKAAEEITNQFSNAKAYQIDFGNTEDLSDFLAEINQFDPDILINNFYNGSFIDQYFHKVTPEKIRSEFERNVLPTLEITQECIKIFRKKKMGRIISILTSSLVSPPIGSSVYNANKAYLQQMSKHWALENVKFGITSNCISPSFISTDLHKDMDDRMKDGIISAYPIRETLEGKDIANAVYFCINSGKHFNGNNMFLDVSHF